MEDYRDPKFDRPPEGPEVAGPNPRKKTDKTLSVLTRELILGNHAAYEDIYFSYLKKLRTFILSITRDAEVANDITQEVFIALWENREKIDPEKGVLGYMFRIANNKIIKYFRHRTVREGYLSSGNWNEQDSVSGDELLILRETDALIALVLAAMPENRRRIFELSRFEGRSVEEIAKLLGMSQDNVRKHLRIATKEIRDLVSAIAALVMLS